MPDLELVFLNKPVSSENWMACGLRSYCFSCKFFVFMKRLLILRMYLFQSSSVWIHSCSEVSWKAFLRILQFMFYMQAIPCTFWRREFHMISILMIRAWFPKPTCFYHMLIMNNSDICKTVATFLVTDVSLFY